MSQMGLFEISKTDYFDEMVEYFDLNIETDWINQFGKSLFEWASNNGHQINVFSIFSGAGGLDIGFRDAGFKINSHLEIERDFCKTLESNSKFFGNSVVNNIDIREYVPTQFDSCDFVIGGPPCQSFSAAGRRAAGVQGIEDSRGTLFEEYVRLLKLLNPKGFLFENVYGITGAQNGNAWEKIKKEFKKAGYNINYRILNTADYGVPQFRERMIIVGLKDGKYQFPRPTHGPDSLVNRDYVSSSLSLQNTPLEEDLSKLKLNGRHGYLLNDIPPGLNYSFYTEKMGHPHPIFAWRSKFSDYLYKADPQKPVRTIKAQGGQYTGPLHWDNRYFTVNEFKRLQSFPDDYIITGNRQKIIHQIGNSVPPQFARILAVSILDQVFHVKPPIKLDYLHETEQLSFRSRKQDLTKEYYKAAQKALGSINREMKIVKPESFSIKITDDFKIIEDSVLEKSYKVVIDEKGKELNINLINNSSDFLYEIKIYPHNTIKWQMPYEYILIKVSSNDTWSFTTAWKSFERIIKKNGIKDDLVQLNGYYQYSPAIDYTIDFTDKFIFTEDWEVLNSLSSNKPIRRIMSYEEISSIFNINPNELLQAAKMLKNLGFEIRNHNTNPQIKEGHMLIPYPFPTLTNLSIQLRKSL